MSKYEELIERLEKLTGPDRAVDRVVAKIAGWHRVEPRHTRSKHGAWIAPGDWLGEGSDGSPVLDSLHGTTMHRDVPAYTASFDATLTLARDQRELSAILRDAHRGAGALLTAQFARRDSEPFPGAPDTFPAIRAALLCALRARAEQEKK